MSAPAVPFESSLLTRESVASAMGVHVSTVDDLRARGHLTAVKIGRAVRITAASYLAYLAEHAAAAPAGTPEGRAAARARRWRVRRTRQGVVG